MARWTTNGTSFANKGGPYGPEQVNQLIASINSLGMLDFGPVAFLMGLERKRRRRVLDPSVSCYRRLGIARLT